MAEGPAVRRPSGGRLPVLSGRHRVLEGRGQRSRAAAKAAGDGAAASLGGQSSGPPQCSQPGPSSTVQLQRTRTGAGGGGGAWYTCCTTVGAGGAATGGPVGGWIFPSAAARVTFWVGGCHADGPTPAFDPPRSVRWYATPRLRPHRRPCSSPGSPPGTWRPAEATIS